MSTDNPRIAAYVPQAIHDCLKEFKNSRQLKSESQAITIALSEFFGVSQEVAHQGSSDLTQRVEDLEAKFTQIKNELLDELKGELLRLIPFSVDERLAKLEANLDTVHQTQAEAKHELLNELKSESVEGQLRLLDEDEPKPREKPGSVTSESSGELPSELHNGNSDNFQLGGLQPMSAAALSKRLGVGNKVVANYKNTTKNQPDKLVKWSQKHDPEGMAWEYREDTKLYHPVVEDQSTEQQSVGA